MWVTVITIGVGALGTVPNGLGKLRIRGRIKTVKNTAQLKSAQILRKVHDKKY